MRIRELQLLRYGHFEGQSLSFPKAEHDIHVVFGDNEAGKSTALEAVGDVLFGIPERTAMGFQFKMSTLQIGASLEYGKDTFEFVRRKGRVDTIVDADGNPILDGEKTLRRFLNAADREFFERLFLLNHGRLDAGSKALLAGGDAGEAMLASSAGLEQLHPVLEALSTEATDLWTPNKSMKRAYYAAKAALDEATKAKRESTIEPRAWRKAKQAVTDAQAAYEDMQSTIRDRRITRDRLDRIRRLHGDLSKLDEAETELVALRDPVLLAEDAVDTLRTARTEQKLIQNQIDLQQKQIQKLNGRIATLVIDASILSMADEIAALDERRVQLSQHRIDIPRRIEQRRALKKQASGLVKELGWTVDDEEAPDRLPKRTVVDKARQLVTQHATLSSEQETARKAHRRIEAEHDRLESVVKDLAEAVDLGPLRAAVRVARDRRPVVGERQRLEGEYRKAQAALNEAIAALSPAIGDEVDLTKAILPERARVSAHRDSVRACQDTLRTTQEEHRKCDRRVSQLRNSIQVKQAELGTMSDEDLAAARETRDEAWGLLSERYIHDGSYDESRWREILGDDDVGERRYEEFVVIADQGADDRFANARDVGVIATLQGTLDESETELSNLDEDVKAAEGPLESLGEQWVGYWAESPVTPADPDAGLAWLDQALECKDLMQKRTDWGASLASAQQQEAGFVSTLLEELKNYTAEIPEGVAEDLDPLIALAEQIGESIKHRNDADEAERTALAAAAGALTEAADELAGKEAALTEWAKAWTAVLKALHLDVGTTPDTLESHLALIDDLRKCSNDIETNYTARIDGMQADLDRYEEDAQSVGEKLGADEAEDGVDELVKALVQRLKVSETNDAQKAQDEAEIERLEEDIERLDAEQQSYVDTIALLADSAGVKDEKLEQAAAASDRRRALEHDIEVLVEAIEKNGDNKSLKELREESKGVDLDTATVTIREVDDELEALEAEFPDRRDALTTATQQLNDIGEHGDAAKAESQRQQALADLERVAERFVRVVSASALLQWSVDRFRLKNQKPLLDRASALFALITRGSFDRVVIEYEDDTPVLAGRRPTGEVTALDGMSSGSRDQLYLALRLASVEDYAAKASAMPFVGDDLFIQHDKKRTREALSAMVELSKFCQVILFSLDEAFFVLAKKVLPAKSNLITLS